MANISRIIFQIRQSNWIRPPKAISLSNFSIYYAKPIRPASSPKRISNGMQIRLTHTSLIIRPNNFSRPNESSASTETDKDKPKEKRHDSLQALFSRSSFARYFFTSVCPFQSPVRGRSSSICLPIFVRGHISRPLFNFVRRISSPSFTRFPKYSASPDLHVQFPRA